MSPPTENPGGKTGAEQPRSGEKPDVSKGTPNRSFYDIVRKLALNISSNAEQKEGTKSAEENMDKYLNIETMPNLPGVECKVLFTEDFRYRDMEGTLVSQKSAPALFRTATGSDDTLVKLADADGKILGTVRKDAVPNYEWNTRAVFQANGESVDNYGRSGTQKPEALKLKAGDICAILETRKIGDNYLYKIAPPFGSQIGSRSFDVPIWIADVAKTGKSGGDVNLMLDVDQASRVSATLQDFVTKMKPLSDPSRRKNVGDALKFCQQEVAAAILGQDTRVSEADMEKVNEYLQMSGLSTSFLRIYPGKIAFMDATGFKSWIGDLAIGVEAFKNVAKNKGALPNTGLIQRKLVP